MLKKVLKMSIIVVFIITILMNLITITSYSAGNIIDANKVLNHLDIETPEEITDVARTFIGVLQIIGSVVAVAVIMVIGIKYIIGSVEEKAEYKKVMIPYLVGAILLFSITNLVPLMYDLMKSANILDY